LRLLLDSNALYRFIAEPDRLRAAVFAAIADPESDVFYSAINLWELGIKRAKGRFVFDDQELLRGIADQRFRELPITARHGLEAASLPPHHADPFDRMLIAQARLEGLTLVTSDRAFWQYRVLLMEA
jgi:PIN domain nuclease of toxin-antitoxin system